METRDLKTFDLVNKFIETQYTKKWGYYVDHLRLPKLVIKTLVIEPSQSISLQRHDKRTEYWTIAKGMAGVFTGNNPESMQGHTYKQGNSLIIHAGQWHQVTNLSMSDPLVIVEVQAGLECLEEDIERY